MVDEMTQLGLKHIMFQALRGGIQKSYPSKRYNLKGRKGLCFIIFPNLEMTKRSSHPDHQLTRSQFCSHPWCWERLHFGDIFTSKTIPWRFLDITLFHVRIPPHILCVQKPCHWKVETVASNLHGFPRHLQVPGFLGTCFPRHSRSSFIRGF